MRVPCSEFSIFLTKVFGVYLYMYVYAHVYKGAVTKFKMDRTVNIETVTVFTMDWTVHIGAVTESKLDRTVHI